MANTDELSKYEYENAEVVFDPITPGGHALAARFADPDVQRRYEATLAKPRGLLSLLKKLLI